MWYPNNRRRYTGLIDICRKDYSSGLVAISGADFYFKRYLSRIESVSCSTGARSSVNIILLGLDCARLSIVFCNIVLSNGWVFAGKIFRFAFKLLEEVGETVATSIELNVFGTSIVCTVG